MQRNRAAALFLRAESMLRLCDGGTFGHDWTAEHFPEKYALFVVYRVSFLCAKYVLHGNPRLGDSHVFLTRYFSCAGDLNTE